MFNNVNAPVNMISCTRIALALAISLLVISYLAENEVSASLIPAPGCDDDDIPALPKKKKGKKKDSEDCDDEEPPKKHKHKKKKGSKMGGKMKKVEKDIAVLATDFESFAAF